LFLKIILIALFILISPIVLILFLFSVINYLPDLFSYISFNLGREFFAEIHLSNYLSLYLAIVSILVSVIIAYFLYKVEIQQKKRENYQQLNQNKDMTFFFFDRAVEQAFKSQQEIFWDSFDFVDINDNVFTRINSLKSLLSNDQFMLLNKIMDKLKNICELEKIDNYPVIRVVVDDLMELITIPEYTVFQFHLKKAKTVYDLFNEKAVELYNILVPDDKQKIYFKDKIFDQNRNLILERNGDKTKIFDASGRKICDAVVDHKGIVEGEAKIFDYEGILKFEGEFKNHQRNGQGVEYLPDRIKTREGTWQDGKLVDGIIYNVFIWEDKSLFADEICFLADEIPHFSDSENYDELYVCSFGVKNGEKHVIDNSIKTAKEAIDNFKIEKKLFDN